MSHSVLKWIEVLNMDVIQGTAWWEIEKAPPARTVAGLLRRQLVLMLMNVLQNQEYVVKINVLIKWADLSAKKKMTVNCTRFLKNRLIFFLEPMMTEEPNENRPMLIALLVIVSILFAMFVVIAALFMLHSKRTSNSVKPTKTKITVMPEIDSSTSSTIGDRSFKSEKSLISNN